MAGPSTALLSARRLYDMAALARRVAEGWAPLPHQIPPPGDWYGWLLLAGRGAGKTDACANWMIEHVNGPACMPGPIPHWMAIIGPTLGDAVRSGYEGPSGIRAHDPRAVKVTRDGGTVIHWPNGSEAKVFEHTRRKILTACVPEETRVPCGARKWQRGDIWIRRMHRCASVSGQDHIPAGLVPPLRGRAL